MNWDKSEDVCGFTLFNEPFNSYLVYSILQWLIYVLPASISTAARKTFSANSRTPPARRWVACNQRIEPKSSKHKTRYS